MTKNTESAEKLKRLEPIKQFFLNNKAYSIAWGLWILFLVLILSYTATHIGNRTVTPSYWNAAIAWVEGQPLYDYSGRGFIYFPQSAILQIPFAVLPFAIAEIIWRILNITLLSISCYLFSGFFEDKKRDIFFLVLSIVTIPLAYSSARNGQANITITALMPLIIFFMLKNKWWTVSFLSGVSLCLKPFMIVPIALFSGVFPKKFFLRFIFVLIFIILFPYLMQKPEYVTEQLIASIVSFNKTIEIGRTEEYAYLFSMFRILGINIFNAYEVQITLIFAFLYYIYSLLLINKAQKLGIIATMGASAVFILLFSSRTESNTYVLIGPFFAALAFKTWNTAFPTISLWRVILILSYTSILGCHEIGKLVTPENTIWPSPLSTFIISSCAYLIIWNKAKHLPNPSYNQFLQ